MAKQGNRLDALFKTEDEFKLCDGVFVQFAEGDNTIDARRMEEEERVVTLVWHSLGLIQNGGFEYLLAGEFTGDEGFVYTAAAYKKIGAERAYRCFQEALAIFNDCASSEPRSARAERFAARNRATRDRINNEFFDSVPDTKTKLASYIRKHADTIKRLLDRPNRG